MGALLGQRPDPIPLLSKIRRRAGTIRAILRNAHVDPVVHGEPLVSVVLPTYNWSSVLRYSARSALWQTHRNLELLVIGDGCTDDSEQTVASFGDERVTWLNLEENSGSQAIPNNAGLELARGEYVAYLGHDDVWHPKHLALMVSYLQRGSADLGYSMAEVIGPPGSGVRGLSGRVRGEDLIPGTWLPASTIVHRTAVARRAGGWLTWEEGDGPPDLKFVERAIETGARPIRVPAMTVFKFPSAFRQDCYRDRPSHEQEAYVRRVEGERFLIERELAALALTRLSPKEPHLVREEPTPNELVDPMAQYRWMRRVRGLD